MTPISYLSQFLKVDNSLQVLFNERINEKKKLFFNLCISVCIVLIMYVCLYMFIKDYFAAIVVAIGAFVFTPITLWLEKNNFAAISRVFFIISCHCYIYFTSLSMMHTINVEYYYFPALLLPLLIFEISDFKKVIFCISTTLAFWLATHFAGHEFVPQHWLMQNPPSELLKPVNFLGACLILLIFSREFVVSNLRLKDLLVKQSEDKGIILQQANAELQKIADSLNEAQAVAKLGSWKYDLFSGKITWSKQMFSIFNTDIKLGEPNYSDHKKTIHPDDQEMWESTVNKALSDGRSYTMRFRLNHEDSIWIEAKGEAMRDTEGKIIGLFGTCQDITSEILAQHKLIQSSKMSSLGEMAGGIAHEINNPLTIISGKVWHTKSKIEKGIVEPDKIIESLNLIAKTTDRIAKIIKGLRSFSRNSENDLMEPISINQVIDETLELCSERFKNHSIEIRLKIEGTYLIKGRSAQIGQVLMNLLGNAHDAIADLQEKWVEIKLYEMNNTVKIAITDSGHGIPDHVVQKMMQPFFTTKDVGKGTGLGLSISKGIIEDHSGKLTYHLNNGHTQFLVEFPVHSQQQSA